MCKECPRRGQFGANKVRKRLRRGRRANAGQRRGGQRVTRMNEVSETAKERDVKANKCRVRGLRTQFLIINHLRGDFWLA